jgi:HAD superfamily hydrolase (TIGR01509 family)
MTKAAVLVDVDGTLVDSNYLHALAWFRALRDAGRVVPMARLHRLIGMGSDQLMEEVVGEYDDALSDAVAQQFAPLRDEVTVFPRAAELLRTLHENGLTVVLATSGRPDDVRAIREKLDADEWIDEQVSSEEVDRSKPAPDIFGVALERAGTDADHAIVIGDTGWDVDAAARCGLRCVTVTTGGWSRPELEGHGAVAVYEDVAELLDDLDRGPIARLTATRLR